MPHAARDYVSFIESYVGCPVDMIGVGFRRDQTIMRVDPWTRS
ncbi:MAG: adenylosuccinate synthetase [Spirochaetota bacterium]